jgi:hypothetical protein
VEECTFFRGVNSSWGINTTENKDLLIKKIIRLHNQHYTLLRTVLPKEKNTRGEITKDNMPMQLKMMSHPRS